MLAAVKWAAGPRHQQVFPGDVAASGAIGARGRRDLSRKRSGGRTMNSLSRILKPTPTSCARASASRQSKKLPIGRVQVGLQHRCASEVAGRLISARARAAPVADDAAVHVAAADHHRPSGPRSSLTMRGKAGRHRVASRRRLPSTSGDDAARQPFDAGEAAQARMRKSMHRTRAGPCCASATGLLGLCRPANRRVDVDQLPVDARQRWAWRCGQKQLA